MSRSPKRKKNWLHNPPPDETPRERQYREGVIGLLHWMAKQVFDELVAEAMAAHGAAMSGVVGGGAVCRTEIDTQLSQGKLAQERIFDLGCIRDGVSSFDPEQGIGMTRLVRTVEGIVVV